jgi:hypothetical protein
MLVPITTQLGRSRIVEECLGRVNRTDIEALLESPDMPPSPLSLDTSPDIERRQVEIWRHMTPEEKGDRHEPHAGR